MAGRVDARALEESLFIRAVAVTKSDVMALDTHPALRAFYWFGEDAPDRIWVPVTERLTRSRQPARICQAGEWVRIPESRVIDSQ